MACLRLFSSLLVLAAGLHAADPGLLNLAPPEARIAAGINVTQAQATPFGRYLLSKVRADNPDFQKFVAATGFDPRTDLSEILVLTPGGPDKNRKLVLVRGNFDRVRIEETAKAHGAKVTEYKGAHLLNGPNASNTEVLSILDPTVAVAGDPESVRQAIERRGSNNTALAPDLLGEMQRVSGLYDAWFVSLVPVSEFAGRMPDQRVNGALKGDALKSVKQVSGGVNLRENPVKFAAEVLAGSPEDANGLATALQFLAGLAQMGNQQQPALPSALKSAAQTLNIAAVGNTVNIAFSIPEEVLEAPPAKRPKRRIAPAGQRKAAPAAQRQNR